MIDVLVLAIGGVAAAAIAGYAIASITVDLLELAGLVWTAAREERRHRGEGLGDELEAAPVRRILSAREVFSIDLLDDPVIRGAIAAPPRRATPLADRRAMMRRRRLVAVTGGRR